MISQATKIGNHRCACNYVMIYLSGLGVVNSRKHFNDYVYFRRLRNRTLLHYITKARLYILLTPLNPTFNIVKFGFTGVYIIFLISVQKHRLWIFVKIASPKRF